MNDTLAYADAFSRAFAHEPEFLGFLRDINKNSGWSRRQANSLRVVAMEDNDPLTTALRKQYSMVGEEGILDDTMEHTRLLLKAEDELTPIRSCAIKTILDRARINGYALTKLAKPHLAEVLNYCLQIANGDALLWYSEGKISAVHAGDPKDYSVLEIPDLFEHTVNYLEEHYPGYTFVTGSFDHSTVTAIWELTGQDDLVDAYMDALKRHGLLTGDYSDIRAAVRLVTSNTGISGANLFPMLYAGKASLPIPLGTPLKEDHKNGADMERFDENLSKLFAQYDIGLKALTALLDVELWYPVNAMQGVLKDVGVPKRLAAEVIEQYRSLHGEHPDTAHSVYYAMNEILFNMERDGATGSRIAAMEENLSRALHVKWSSFDIPGNLPW